MRLRRPASATVLTLALLAAPTLGAAPPTFVPPDSRQPGAATKTPTAPARFPAALEAAFGEAVRQALARAPAAGLSVGVQQGGRRWTAAFGRRDLSRKLPATVDTTYRFASITKSFTAVAVMQLVEAGKLTLDADIHTLAPTYPRKQWPITVEQLLGHLGGVPTYKGGEARNLVKVDSAGAIALFADRPLAVEPGTEFVYSTWGYVLLGAAIESASGLSYGDYLARHVFGPSGMKHAALDDFATRTDRHAVGYVKRNGALVASERLDVSSRSAGGGTRGDVSDLLAFGRALLEGKLVSAESAARMLRPMVTREGKLVDYGLGFATYPLNGHYQVAHAGAQPETTTLLVVLPAEDLVVALASNLEGEASRQKALAGRFIELLAEDGRPRRPLHAEAAADQVALEGLHRLFTYGAAYQLARVSVPAPRPIEAAFAELERQLSPARLGEDLPGALEAIRRGHEPRGGQWLLQAGAFMAQTIEAQSGLGALRALRAGGGLAFFRAYREAWAKAKLGPALSLEGLEARAAAWDAAVRQSAVPELARARLDAHPGAEALWAKVEAGLAGAAVHESYAGELLEVAEAEARKGHAAAALAWLERAVKAHPGAVTPLLALADALLAQGKVDEGRARYREAYARLAALETEPVEVLLAHVQKVDGRQARRAALDAAVAAAPESGPLWNALALAERALGHRAAEKKAKERASTLGAAAVPAASAPGTVGEKSQ